MLALYHPVHRLPIMEAIGAPAAFGENKNILVATARTGGFGDIVCALKVAKLLHTHLKIPLEQITVLILNPCKSGNTPFPSTPFRVVSTIPSDLTIDLVVMAPFSSSCLSLIQKAFPTKPLLNFCEYASHARSPSSENRAFYFMGLSLHLSEIGILISEDLVKWGFSEESLLSSNRIAKCSALSSATKERLLEAHSLESFDATNRLYYGYTNQLHSLIAYVKAIAAIDLYKSPQKNIVIIAPTRDDPFSSLPQEYLTSCGIGTLVIKRPLFEDQTIVYRSDMKKTLTLLTETLPFDEINILLQASEPETIVTGDQSLSEAISANKVFCYEILSHKRVFASSLQAAFKKQTLLTTPITFTPTCDDEEIVQTLCNTFRTPIKYPNAFPEFNRSIVAHRNCNTFITSAVKQILFPKRDDEEEKKSD